MLAGRMKQLRTERHMTQVQLAETLGVSKGTVAMWETGKRKPSFEMLNALSDIFDKRIDYIMGYSDDPASPALSEEDVDQLSQWETEDDLYKTIMRYLRLDEYGKDAVERVIAAEYKRCRDQETTFPANHFQLDIKIQKSE